MPIRGLTDREGSFPIIGTLRKGAPKTSETAPGKDLTYFRYVPQPGEETTMTDFASIYGEKPTMLDIRLPFATAEQNLEAWREQWVAGGLVHRCDGETTVMVRNPQTGDMLHVSQPCPGGCKQVGRLALILPDFERLAIIVMMTTSTYDIIALSENLKALEALRGDCRGIPLVLKRKPRKVSTPEVAKDGKRTGRRVRREKWLLTIEARPDWVSLQLEAMHQAALPSAKNAFQIAVPVAAPRVQLADRSAILNLAAAPDTEDDDEPTEGDFTPVANMPSPATPIDRPGLNNAPEVAPAAAGHASAAESDAQFTALPSIHDEPPEPVKNGARLPGVTGVPDWPLRCNTFAAAHKQYRLKGSEMPDFPHILGAISKLSINGQGVTTVTPANVDEVFQRLEARTLSAEADAAMKNG
jgi:hypothetical protein